MGVLVIGARTVPNSGRNFPPSVSFSLCLSIVFVLRNTRARTLLYAVMKMQGSHAIRGRAVQGGTAQGKACYRGKMAVRLFLCEGGLGVVGGEGNLEFGVEGSVRRCLIVYFGLST